MDFGRLDLKLPLGKQTGSVLHCASAAEVSTPARPARFACPYRLARLGHQPFKLATRVRIPLGVPLDSKQALKGQRSSLSRHLGETLQIRTRDSHLKAPEPPGFFALTPSCLCRSLPVPLLAGAALGDTGLQRTLTTTRVMSSVCSPSALKLQTSPRRVSRISFAVRS